MTMTDAMENNVIGVGGGSLLDLDHGKNHGVTSLLDLMEWRWFSILANRWSNDPLNPKVSIVEK